MEDIPFDPDITPPWPSPTPTPDIPPPIDHRLGPGQGFHAPRIDGGTLPCLGGGLWEVVLAARGLFGTARHPRADGSYRRIRAGLEVVRLRLSAALRDDPDDDTIAELLSEVIGYLPRQETP